MMRRRRHDEDQERVEVRERHGHIEGVRDERPDESGAEGRRDGVPAVIVVTMCVGSERVQPVEDVRQEERENGGPEDAGFDERLDVERVGGFADALDALGVREVEIVEPDAEERVF